MIEVPRPCQVFVTHPCHFVVFSILAVALIRVLLSLIRSYQASAAPDAMPYATLFERFFLGQGPTWKSTNYHFKGDVGEYGASALVGLIEVLAYAFLFATHNATVVGAWITLKTISIYFRWASDRVLFNLFLAGNALTVAAGWYVSGDICVVT